MSNEIVKTTLLTEVFSSFEKDYQVARDTVESMPMKTEKDCENAGDFLKLLKNGMAKLEAKKDELKRPHLDANKRIQDDFNIYKKKLEPLIKTLGKRVANKLYEIEQERKRKAEEEKQRQIDEDKKRQEELEKLAEKTEDEEVLNMAVNIENEIKISEEKDIKVSKNVKGSFSTTTFITTWKHKVVDISKVDRKYLCIDDSKVKAYIKTFKEKPDDINGLEFYPEHDSQSR